MKILSFISIVIIALSLAACSPQTPLSAGSKAIPAYGSSGHYLTTSTFTKS